MWSVKADAKTSSFSGSCLHCVIRAFKSRDVYWSGRPADRVEHSRNLFFVCWKIYTLIQTCSCWRTSTLTMPVHNVLCWRTSTLTMPSSQCSMLTYEYLYNAQFTMFYVDVRIPLQCPVHNVLCWRTSTFTMPSSQCSMLTYEYRYPYNAQFTMFYVDVRVPVPLQCPVHNVLCWRTSTLTMPSSQCFMLLSTMHTSCACQFYNHRRRQGAH